MKMSHKLSNRKPAEVVRPSVYLKDELKARHWDNLWYLNYIFGSCSRDIIDIIYNGASITDKTARVIAKELGTSAELWLNLQKAWDERK